jgi:hypothetical protein
MECASGGGRFIEVMHSAIRQPLLKHLASIAIAVTAGLDPGPGLQELPVQVVTELAEEAVGSDWESDDRRRLLRLLANDPRAPVRARVADVAGAVCDPTCEGAHEVLRDLVTDRVQRVREAVAHGLAELLGRASPCERTAIACEWVLSPEPSVRAAVASSLGMLGQRVPVVLSDLMLEVLATDDEPKVRVRAASALAQAVAHDPRANIGLLRRLVYDTDRNVREIARDALGTVIT